MQVGDPFEEKRLIEACLELLDRGLVVGIQDLGGAGLTCATSETAARGGMGMDVDVDAVPRREPAMAPFEVMTSESQERMLAIVTPADRDAVEEVCRRWEVRATVIGTVTERRPSAHPRRRRRGAGRRARRLALRRRPALRPAPGRPVPTSTAPPCRRPRRRARRPRRAPCRSELGADVLALLADASWVYRQYDHQLFLNTVVGPGEDAAVLRLAAPGLPAERARASPSPPTPTRAGARSTPAPARP